VETFLVLKSKSQIVLLDEPFSHLNPLQIDIIKNIIRVEKKQKIIIITDHLYSHIIEVSDEVYLLKNKCTNLINNIEELEDYKYLSENSLS
jgi:ABC-type lipopolysaccharide export system ATPase subunit